MQPEKLEEVRAWLTKADHDLRAAERLLADPDPLPDVAVYHCQQAAEKALKGFLTLHDASFGKTHALVALVTGAAEMDASFLELLPDAEYLTPFSWRFRYPGELLQPEPKEADEALQLARRVLSFVLARLDDFRFRKI